MQNFGGQIRCIMGDVQVRYKASQSSHASRKMPRSPRLAHKAPVMQANNYFTWQKKRLERKQMITPGSRSPGVFLQNTPKNSFAIEK